MLKALKVSGLVLLTLIVAVILYNAIIARLWNGLQMIVLQHQLTVGMPRADAYARIRASGRVAINPYYDRWDKLPDGTYISDSWRNTPQGLTRVRDDIEQWPVPTWVPPRNRIPQRLWYADAWPNEAHPWAEVEYNMGSLNPFCSNGVDLRIDFDDHERIARVQQKPFQDCEFP